MVELADAQDPYSHTISNRKRLQFKLIVILFTSVLTLGSVYGGSWVLSKLLPWFLPVKDDQFTQHICGSLVGISSVTLALMLRNRFVYI